MNSIFLDNEMMSFLAAVRAREEIDEETLMKQSKKLEEIFRSDSEDDSEPGDGQDDNDDRDGDEDGSTVSMPQLMVETYLRSPVRVITEFHKQDRIVRRGYYFEDDLIVMLNAYRDGGEFMWLPSITYLMGSLADMIGDQAMECENEEFNGSLKELCSEENYLDVLINSVTEEKYRNLLTEDRSQTEYLWLRGSSSAEASRFFVYVIFKNQGAFYYTQENEEFRYGCADLPTIVNILGTWMLYRHRDLIIQMQQLEEEEKE